MGVSARSEPCSILQDFWGWGGRNRESFSCFAEGVVARGWSAALPGYTVAPAATLTQIVQELRMHSTGWPRRAAPTALRGPSFFPAGQPAGISQRIGSSECTGGAGDFRNI